MLTLNFTPQNTTHPIISYITTTHNIHLNILQPHINNTKNPSFRFLLIHIPHISQQHFNQFKH
ncbi:NIL domain-containing protein, partial [Staphylococcus epidermidis]|uniref:NIL domain-containing protein n=1 Tax=Staphylococcus epidermidis TaxID=1282 RepID=UPI0037D9A850